MTAQEVKERGRFSNKFTKTKSGCWVWKGTTSRDGYGQFRSTCGGKRIQMFGAHRVSYWLTFGEIPEGLQVLHKCDVRNCVNPEHLFLGTNIDNVDDKMSKGRHKTHDLFATKTPELRAKYLIK